MRDPPFRRAPSRVRRAQALRVFGPDNQMFEQVWREHRAQTLQAAALAVPGPGQQERWQDQQQPERADEVQLVEVDFHQPASLLATGRGFERLRPRRAASP